MKMIHQRTLFLTLVRANNLFGYKASVMMHPGLKESIQIEML